MTERAAKLTVKVKLHAAQPKVLPGKVPPARLSKLKVSVGLLLMCLVTATGYWVWRQWIDQASHHAVGPSAPANVAALDSSDSGSRTEAGDVEGVAADNRPPHPVKSLQESNRDASAVGGQVPAALSLADDLPTGEATSETATVVATVVGETTTALTTMATTTATTRTEPEQSSTAGSRAWPEGFSRIVLAATMERLEPGAAIDALVAQQQIQRLYLFTELKGYAGQQLIHRWSYAGKVQTEALLTIEDSPWRTYSEKWLLPDQLGAWRVEIVDQQQNVLYQHDFLYQ